MHCTGSVNLSDGRRTAPPHAPRNQGHGPTAPLLAVHRDGDEGLLARSLQAVALGVRQIQVLATSASASRD